MKISLAKDTAVTTKAHIVAVGVREKELSKNPHVKRLDAAMAGALLAAAKDEGFKGSVGTQLKVPGSGKVAAGWVLLVGLGGAKAGAHDARRVGVQVSRAAKRQASVAVVLPKADVAQVRAAAEGLIGGAYRYDTFFTGDRKPEGKVQRASILGLGTIDAAARTALKEGQILGEAVDFARDLVNAPPNDLLPVELANRAASAAKGTGIRTSIWNKAKIEKAGMRLFLAVNQGGGNEPRFVHMVYKPARAKGKVAFVGKGLTFDSGGLCIKPAKSMLDMKCDMAGSATTFGVILAAARMKLPVEVHAIVGCTENMSGDYAYRPGDVYESMDGKTVEIINTDAEGRLVLADIMTYTRDKVKPDYMITHATLTGACMVALGKWRAALYANDGAFGDKYGAAATRANENFWQMPLDDELAETLKSPIADLKHTGDAHGGSITAALFLREFVGASRWVHCDIAGPAFLDQAHGLAPKGGTGFGVATGVEFLRDIAGSK